MNESTRVYVEGLASSVTDTILSKLFSQAGLVVSVDLVTPGIGWSTGLAYVEMSTKEESDKTIRMFNGYTLHGFDLKVGFYINHSRTKMNKYAAVYVDGLDSSATKAILFKLFSQAGSVVFVDLVKPGIGHSKGIAIVEMSTEEEADRAVGMFNGYPFDGYNIRVRFYEKRLPDKNLVDDASKASKNMSATVYVDNLSPSTTEKYLSELLDQAGSVVSVDLIKPGKPGQSRGLAIVEMSTVEEADKAIRMFNGYSLDGYNLHVGLYNEKLFDKNLADHSNVKTHSNIEGRLLRVFLCHAHSDSPSVRTLFDRLIKDKLDVWLDKESLLPGSDWEYEIRKAVHDSDVVIVCLSKNFNKKGFRQKEVRLALEAAMEQPEGEIFIIPARLEECENLESLRKWHWVDLFESDGYEKLMRTLKIRAHSVGAIL